MISSDHPFHFLRKIFSRQRAVFSFSRYAYYPDSLFDDREYLVVSSDDLTPSWLTYELQHLRPDQELALHSNVVIGARTWHIPMVDFSTTEVGPRQMARIGAFLPPRIFAEFEFFFSGRSFHGYSLHLMTPKEWIELLGRLLLINEPNEPPIVDSRWIGHRLIAGYCSLRFSNNSDRHSAMPKRVPLRRLAHSGSAVSAPSIMGRSEVKIIA